MIPLAAIRDRLLAQCASIKRVHGAVQLSAALERGAFEADAYVTLLEVLPGKNQLVNAVSQRLSVKIAVIQVVKYANDPTGEKQADALEARRDEVLPQIINWRPQDDFDVFTYAGGKLISFDAPAVVWSDEFITGYLLRSIP